MDRALRARVGEATFKAWYAGQWLSDNGPQYRATATILWLYLTGVVLIITPVYNQESNGCPGHKPHSDFQGRRACPLWCQRVAEPAGLGGRGNSCVKKTDGRRTETRRPHLLIVVAGNC